MAKLTIWPAGKVMKVRPGQSLIQAARSARVVIPQRCGGHASCLMCKVVVEEGELAPPTALERRKLSEEALATGIRLACQAKTVDRDCVVRIPENKLKSVIAAALKRQAAEQDDEL